VASENFEKTFVVYILLLQEQKTNQKYQAVMTTAWSIVEKIFLKQLCKA